MVEITITIPAAAYEWYDQLVESYGGIYDNVQDYLSCQVSGRWREETNTWNDGGSNYGNSNNDDNKGSCKPDGAVL